MPSASLYRPDEYRESASRYGLDIGVNALTVLSWALWHRGYTDRSRESGRSRADPARGHKGPLSVYHLGFSPTPQRLESA
jgi:hypothetical protein